MFVDELKIKVSGGPGGSGVVRWHREKFISKGGPNGGDGGNGGDLFIEAKNNLSLLSHYRMGEHFSAQKGFDGGSKLKKGKNGQDLILYVPVGTIVKNIETGEVFDFDTENKKTLIASGGIGGHGNAYYKSSVNTTPKKATPGKAGQTYDLHLVIKLITDVGIIGLPNAGKSTLLNELTKSNARVANYPFTTLSPNLGVFNKYIVADIPGLIKNAGIGKGLGHKFLKHISRTRLLIHLISVENENPLESYKTIREELEKYDKTLLDKKEIVFLSKVDLVDQSKVKELLKKMPKGTEVISSYDYDSILAVGRRISKEI